MCVRYTLHKPDAAVGAVSVALGKRLEPPPWAEPRFNVALTQSVPVIALRDGEPEIGAMRWGFPGAGAAGLLPNAKAETARTLPSFRDAVLRRRCLVPANGFYEWQDRAGIKWPHLFTLREGEPFAFAGLWSPKDHHGSASFCILTTTPNGKVAPLHNRMPVLLTGADCVAWIRGEPWRESDWAALTAPLNEALLEVRPVSRFVSSTRNEGPGCHAPADTGGEQLDLL